MAKVSKIKSSSKKTAATRTLSKKVSSISLPSVQLLYVESWDLFTKTIFIYLKIVGLGLLLFFLIGLIGLLISLPFGINFLGSHGNIFQHPTAFQIGNGIFLGLWLIVSLFSALTYSLVTPILSMLLFQDPKQKSLRLLIQKSKAFILQYFLTNLLIAFLIMGGFFLFVLPGLLIGFFFLFVLYEIVLEKQKTVPALRTSYALVKNNFWSLLGRYLLVEIAAVVVSSLLNKLVGQSSAFSLLSLGFSFAAGWFMQAYQYTLYKQVKKVSTKVATNSSLNWIWIVALVGWSLLLFLGIAVGQGLAHFFKIPTNSLQNIPPGTV